MTPSDTYSCLMSVNWDWSSAVFSNRESRKQQAYMFSTLHYNAVSGNEDAYPFAVVDTRLKVRGNGRVMSVRYESEEGKDFQLIGHATPFTVETEG